MIHSVDDAIFSLPLADYTLTFDDGLYSQYAYLHRFADVPTDKIFFISTKFICRGSQSDEFPLSNIAHDKARSGNYEDFMTPSQIRDIIAMPRCHIGGHGHSHIRLRDILTKVDIIKNIIQDTETMMDVFLSEFGISPTKFCFPYNDDVTGLYPAMIRRYGFTEMYGRERIPVEKLLHSRRQPACLDV